MDSQTKKFQKVLDFHYLSGYNVCFGGILAQAKKSDSILLLYLCTFADNVRETLKIGE